MTSNWATTHRRIAQRDKTESAIIVVVGAIALPAAGLIVALGDSHPGLTQLIGGVVLVLLTQASIAALFPDHTYRAWAAITAKPSRRLATEAKTATCTVRTRPEPRR